MPKNDNHTMNATTILNLRLYNQLLTTRRFTRAAQVVAWLGAMQSQNLEMAKWGIGARLEGVKIAGVEAALSSGEILRTHILRPTWHFVAAEDIHWMLALTAPRIKPAFDMYARERGVSTDFIKTATKLLPHIIEERGHITREELAEELAARGFETTERHDVRYVLSHAELEGIVCSGEVRGSKPTYALLHRRAPGAAVLSHEESLERLARRYFDSHGPATLEDFRWWSGLTKTDARKGMALISAHFISEVINGKTYLMPTHIQTPPAHAGSALLLPAFDEYVVSYKDREEIIDAAYYRKVLTINGLFSPTMHLDGKVVGTWKRVVKKNGAVAQLSFFETTPKKVHSKFNEAVIRYAEFNAI